MSFNVIGNQKCLCVKRLMSILELFEKPIRKLYQTRRFAERPNRRKETENIFPSAIPKDAYVQLFSRDRHQSSELVFVLTDEEFLKKFLVATTGLVIEPKDTCQITQDDQYHRDRAKMLVELAKSKEQPSTTQPKSRMDPKVPDNDAKATFGKRPVDKSSGQSPTKFIKNKVREYESKIQKHHRSGTFTITVNI